MGKKIPIEILHKKALKYKNIRSFQKNDPNAYSVACKRGILDYICKHMKRLRRKPYTINEIVKLASKESSIRDFKKNNNGAYQAALRLNIMHLIYRHLPKRDRTGKNNPNFKYTDADLKKIASKEKTVKSFVKNNYGAYQSALERGILNKICNHMNKSTNDSSEERNLFNIIKKEYPRIQKLRDRKVRIENKSHIEGFDIDIFIPELRKGVEFDGKYWHSFEGLKRSRPNWPKKDILNYHQIKDDYFLSKGIHILHIKEEDWNKDKEACIKKCFEFLKGNIP